MRHHVRLLILLVSTAAFAGAGDPQPSTSDPSTLKNLSLEELSQIEVTSPSREPQDAFRTPVAIYVITGDDIKRSGATSIPEALRLAPGVEVARIDANKWSIGIRGFGSRFSRGVLVLIDGRTVYSTLLAGTYWEVQDTFMDDIDRIEVIRGPGGTIWGPNAVNGVINVITKNTQDTHGMLASAGSGNEEQGFANFRYGGGDDHGFNYRFYGKAFTRGPEYHPDGASFDDWRSTQGGFRTDWKPNDRDTFDVQGDIYIEEAGERVNAVSYTPPYSQNIDANADLSGGNVLARWTRQISDRDNIQVQAYYDRTNRHESNFGELRNTFDVDFLQHLRLPARQQVTWGLAARFSLADDLPVVSGLAFLPAKRTDELFSGFVQDEIGLIDNRLSLILGTKLLRTNFTGIEAEPSARLLWTPTSNQTIWTSFTHAVRTPSDAEEDFLLSGYQYTLANGVPFFAAFLPNKGFQPEQLNGYELGYRRLLGPKLYVDVAAFYNHYHDLFDEEIIGGISLDDNPPPEHLLLPAQFGNGLRGETAGVEIAPEWRPTGFWRLRGSYSYLDMHIRKAAGSIDIGSAPGINGSSPHHEVGIQSSLDLSKVLQFDANFRYISALPAQSVSAYSTGNVRLAWRFRNNWELALVGQNLLQPWHVEDGGDPATLIGIRRSAYVKLSWMK